jgi:putative FmdB family regulatory protein
MPLFDLECQACQHRWEDMVRGGEIPPCPQCGAADAQKIPSVGRVQSPFVFPKDGGSVEFKRTERTKDGWKVQPVITPPPKPKG